MRSCATTLEVDGVAHLATHVFFCRTLSGPKSWRCMLTASDDTIHTTEFPYESIATFAREAKSLDPSGAAVELLKVGAGEPGRMHRTGYGSAVMLDVKAGGTIVLPTRKEPWLVFAIARGPEGWLRKYVWVLW